MPTIQINLTPLRLLLCVLGIVTPIITAAGWVTRAIASDLDDARMEQHTAGVHQQALDAVAASERELRALIAANQLRNAETAADIKWIRETLARMESRQ